MRVRVLFFGVLKDLVGAAEEHAELPDRSTLADLFNSVAQRFETVRIRRSSILMARNHEFANPDAVLADGDEVAFLPPVSGGSTIVGLNESILKCRLVRDVIDTRQLTSEVARSEHGGIVTFDGIVRNNTRGRPTTFLEYECYQPLALRQMEKIGNEILSAFGIGGLGIVHRLGRLAIGESSIVIVAAAPHRKPAFEAAHCAIDRLKREVPIWKKEFFEDGAVWVEGEWDQALLEAQCAS